MEVSLSNMLKNSYKHYHARGVNYLCLQNTWRLRLKAYFFDQPSDPAGVVSPHDHRYSFTNHVLTGAVKDTLYTASKYGEQFFEYSWRSPLSRADLTPLYSPVAPTKLVLYHADVVAEGLSYQRGRGEIHSLQILEPRTIIVQEEKKTPSAPLRSRVFMRTEKFPTLEGLYEKFEPGEIVRLVGELNDRAGMSLSLSP